MWQLCQLAENKCKTKIKDMRSWDKGINKYKKYLKEEVHIDFKKLNIEWSHIGKLKKLRDLITHSSIVEIENTEKNSKDIRTLKSIDKLTFRTKGTFVEFQIEDNQLIEDFCGTISIFLDGIYYEKAIS